MSTFPVSPSIWIESSLHCNPRRNGIAFSIAAPASSECTRDNALTQSAVL